MAACEFRVRAATPEDAPGIAAAHVDAIHSQGPAAYDREIVAEWGAPRTGDRYVQAMANGEHFFVAVDRDAQILGFSAHRIEAGAHRIAVYVRGSAGRRGVGTALLSAGEDVARARGAGEIHVDASLVAVGFYAASGFLTVAAGVHPLGSGRPMACVRMYKPLASATGPDGG